VRSAGKLRASNVWDSKSRLEKCRSWGSSRRKAPARGGTGASGEVSPKDGWTNRFYKTLQNGLLRGMIKI